MNRIAMAVAAALMGAAGLAQPAHAGFISIGTNLTIGSETYQLVSVTCNNGVTCNSGNSYNGLQWGTDGFATGITIEDPNTGSIVSTAGGAPSDVTLIFEVYGSVAFNKVGLLINGSDGGKPVDDPLMTTSENVYNFSNTYSLVPTPHYDDPEEYVSLPAGYSALEVTKDIKVGTPTQGETLSITSVNQDFIPAPEPASLSLLLFGMTAAAVARRKRLRR